MSIEDKMKQLSIVAYELSRASDELNERLERIEDDFARNGPYVEKWLDQELNADGDIWQLGWGYKDDRWMFLIRSVRYSTPKRLLNASRHIRIASSLHIPYLAEVMKPS